VFWQTVSGFFAAKDLRSIGDQNRVLLSNGQDILGWWRECFKDLLNPVTITTLDTHEVHLGEENSIAAAEVFLAAETLKAAGCDETKFHLKCSNTRMEEFFGWLVGDKWPGVLAGHRKICRLGWSFPHTRKETGEGALTTRASLS